MIADKQEVRPLIDKSTFSIAGCAHEGRFDHSIRRPYFDRGVVYLSDCASLLIFPLVPLNINSFGV